MTIDKAIEILLLKVSQNVFQDDPDARAALILSIQALLFFKTITKEYPMFASARLVGQSDK